MKVQIGISTEVEKDSDAFIEVMTKILEIYKIKGTSRTNTYEYEVQIDNTDEVK